MNQIQILRTKELLNPFIQTISWIASDFAPPSPSFVKRRILQKEGIKDGAWIETGTHLGGTTKSLSKTYPSVISIEPSKWLHRHASIRLRNHTNIQILNGTSEELLESAIEATINKSVNLWLDGHYSAGVTHQGERDTPIMRELEIIGKHLHIFEKVAIFIDDVRCFTAGSHRNTNYPEIWELPDWCKRHQATWRIEHDIFIITKNSPGTTSTLAATSSN